MGVRTTTGNCRRITYWAQVQKVGSLNEGTRQGGTALTKHGERFSSLCHTSSKPKDAMSVRRKGSCEAGKEGERRGMADTRIKGNCTSWNRCACLDERFIGKRRLAQGLTWGGGPEGRKKSSTRGLIGKARVGSGASDVLTTR